MQGDVRPVLGATTALDITDAEACQALIGDWRPTHVVNLAGLAAPAVAAKAPDRTWAIHLHGVRNLAEAILGRAPDCRLIQVGSGLVYGQTANSGEPLDERAVLAPLDDYAASKAAGDLALGVYIRKGLKCIRLRPFNHSGPGQSEDFVIPAFAMQIARIEAGLAPPVVRVGNLDAARDILDVADVAEAYALAIRDFDRAEPDAIFNIAAGKAVKIEEILKGLLALSTAAITVERDPSRNRPSDIPIIIGDAEKFRNCFGWSPKHSLTDTLKGTLDDCRFRATALASADSTT
jgi:GDP-4-dehydro-6-deoxy-D-mannose reductase